MKTRFLCLLSGVIFSAIFFCVISAATNNAWASTAFSIAHYLPISNSSVKNGDIITFTNNSYALSRTEYDPLVIGVVNNSPAVSIGAQSAGTYPVVSDGKAYVLVSAINGPIKKDDLITASVIPGVGEKAVHSGYVIGFALQDYASKNPKDIKLIPVDLNIHYFASRVTVKTSILDVLNLSATATYEEPTVVFKYFVAALIVVLSFVFGFFFFGNTANRGIEALGRNPLAGRLIQIGILLNVIITLAIIAAGIIAAVFVLRL